MKFNDTKSHFMSHLNIFRRENPFDSSQHDRCIIYHVTMVVTTKYFIKPQDRRTKSEHVISRARLGDFQPSTDLFETGTVRE